MDLTRRRLLIDLACVGGVVLAAAGLAYTQQSRDKILKNPVDGRARYDANPMPVPGEQCVRHKPK